MRSHGAADVVHRVTSELDQLAVMLYLSSGSCAEEQAMNVSWRALRAARHGWDRR